MDCFRVGRRCWQHAPQALIFPTSDPLPFMITCVAFLRSSDVAEFSVVEMALTSLSSCWFSFVFESTEA